MKRTTISVTYGRRINLGDYSGAHFETTLGAELEDGDDPEACTAQLWEEAVATVKVRAIALYKQRHDQLREIFDGLPVDMQKEILDANTRPD